MARRRGPGSEEAPVAHHTNVPTPCRAGPATTMPCNTSSSLRAEPTPSPPWISAKPHHWHRARKTQDAAMGAPSTKCLQPHPSAPFPAPRLEPPPRTHGLPAGSGKEPPDPASRPPDPAPSRRIERGGGRRWTFWNQAPTGRRRSPTPNGEADPAVGRWIRPHRCRQLRPPAPPRRRLNPPQELHGREGRRERTWLPPSLPSTGPPASGSGGSRAEEARRRTLRRRRGGAARVALRESDAGALQFVVLVFFYTTLI